MVVLGQKSGYAEADVARAGNGYVILFHDFESELSGN